MSKWCIVSTNSQVRGSAVFCDMMASLYLSFGLPLGDGTCHLGGWTCLPQVQCSAPSGLYQQREHDLSYRFDSVVAAARARLFAHLAVSLVALISGSSDCSPCAKRSPQLRSTDRFVMDLYR